MELPKLEIKDESVRNKVLAILKQLNIDESKCKKLLEIFNEELDKGEDYDLESDNISISLFQVWSQVFQAPVCKWKTLSFQNF